MGSGTSLPLPRSKDGAGFEGFGATNSVGPPREVPSLAINKHLAKLE